MSQIIFQMGFSSSTYYVYSPNYIHYSVCKQPPRPYSSIASKKKFFLSKKILPTLKFKTNKPSRPRLETHIPGIGFSQSHQNWETVVKMSIFFLHWNVVSWQMWKKKTLTQQQLRVYNLKVFKNCWHFPTVLPTITPPCVVGKNTHTFALSSKTASTITEYAIPPHLTSK